MDTDGFMIALKDELKPRLLAHGMELAEIGMGEFNDTVLIGVENPKLLIFGNVRVNGAAKDKQFQIPIPPADIEYGPRELPAFLAEKITKEMRKAVGR